MFRVTVGNGSEVAPEEISVTFNDVKGADEAKQELKEIVEFLKVFSIPLNISYIIFIFTVFFLFDRIRTSFQLWGVNCRRGFSWSVHQELVKHCWLGP